MNLKDIAELGYLCGLSTLGEAIRSAECHWDTWPAGSFEELERDIEAAGPDDVGNDTLCVHFLGAERCAEMDRELNACLDAAPAASEGFEFTL